LNRTTRYAYDKLGRRTKRTLPLGQVESYGYNSVGNLITRTDFNGKATTYGYDTMNRMLSKTPHSSFGQAPVTFTYTATGRRATMTDASGVTVYGYDVRDRMIGKQTPQGTLTYSYDGAGNLLTMRSLNQNGSSVDYGYDTLNRLATVTDNGKGTRPGSGTTTYSYDAVGNLAGYVYPNGVETSYEYNTLNRLTSMGVKKGAATLASYGYTLGATGNRLSVTEANGRKVNYTYDDLYRLKSETIADDPVTANNGVIGYDYDAVGNRLTRSSSIAAVPSTTSAYDANDRLASDTYDANGNTTGSGGNVYRYDFENKIIALNPGTANQVTFVYEATAIA
jgi:YD repeat-containing protein